MKIANLAIGLMLGSAVCTLSAQQSMPDMPGMNMPAPPQKPAPAKPKPQPQPQQSMPEMPGMDMAKPTQAKAPASAGNATPAVPASEVAKNKGRDSGKQRAQQSAASVQDSIDQQAGQAGKTPDEKSDRQSVHVPIQDLQEPEALEFRTGKDLPAPELLGEIVSREPMTLEQFLSLADQANPTLAQAQRNVDRSNFQAKQVSLPPDPIFGYNGDHIRGGEYHGGEQGAFFSQEFVLGRKLALRREIYRAEGHSNKMALEVQRARVHNDVARAFFDTLAAQQTVVLRNRLLKVALDNDTNTHELSRIGQVDAAAILMAEVEAEQARIDFLAAQRMFLAHYAQLTTFSGQHGFEKHPLTGSLVEPPGFDPEEYVARDVEQSPLVKRAQADEALGEARLKNARRERVPNLNLTAGEWYSGEELRSGRKAGWETFVQAGVQIPLWNRNQGNVKASEVILDRAHKDVERTRLWTRNQTEPLAQQYLTAQFTAERYRTEMLPRARRAYELQVTKYQQMALEYPPVLQAQHMLFMLQLGYTEALNQQWQAAIALQNYALMNGLDEPLNTGTDSTTINLPTAPGPNQ